MVGIKIPHPTHNLSGYSCRKPEMVRTIKYLPALGRNGAPGALRSGSRLAVRVTTQHKNARQVLSHLCCNVSYPPGSVRRARWEILSMSTDGKREAH